MSSVVKICNLALVRVGAATITSLTEDTNEGRLCNLLYNDVAEEVMAEGAWTSTVTRVALNKTTNTPAYGFSSEFQLPTDPRFIRILSINESVPGTDAYKIEGSKLLTDLSTIKIEYIGFIDDSESYDPLLKRAIISRLAAEFSYTITGSAALAERLFDRYRFEVSDGLSADGQQGSNQLIVSPDLHEVR